MTASSVFSVQSIGRSSAAQQASLSLQAKKVVGSTKKHSIAIVLESSVPSCRCLHIELQLLDQGLCAMAPSYFVKALPVSHESVEYFILCKSCQFFASFEAFGDFSAFNADFCVYFK